MSIKVYLAGPMRGKPKSNFPTFFEAAEALRYSGYEVFNPAEHSLPYEKLPEAEYYAYLRKVLKQDIDWICENADAIALLPGWQQSKGANAEYAVAVALGLEIFFL